MFRPYTEITAPCTGSLKPARTARLAALSVTLLLILCAPRGRAGVATYRLHRTNAPPILDGALSDPCWAKACRVTSFHPLGTAVNATTGAPKTVVLLTYDARALYLGFQCQEPDAAGLDAPKRPHDGPTWRDNGVELFFNPSGDRTAYIQIAVNLAGSVMDGAIAAPGEALDLSWETGASAAVRTGPNQWSMEIAIPFSGLPIVRPRGPWTFHVARNRATAGQHLTMLQTPVSGYHEIANFAQLEGIDLPEWSACVLSVVPGNFFTGINLCQVRVRNWAKTAAALQLTAGIEGAGSPKQSRKTFRIEPGQTVLATLPWELDPGNAGKTFVFEARLPTGNRLIRRQKRSIPTPPPVLGALDRPVFFYSQHRLVAVTIPVNLGEGSRGQARLQWQARDTDGTVVGRGFTTVAGFSALVRLYWPRWFPGRYSLDLKLSRNSAILATAVQPLRLVENPWGE